MFSVAHKYNFVCVFSKTHKDNDFLQIENSDSNKLSNRYLLFIETHIFASDPKFAFQETYSSSDMKLRIIQWLKV